MASTVRNLLNGALYLSIADREFSPVEPSGSQINAALDIFIDLLDVYRSQMPYWVEIKREGEDALKDIEAAYINYVKFEIGNVTYLLTPMNQIQFANYDAVEGLVSIPSAYWYDVANKEIKVYPEPLAADRKFIIGYLPLITLNNLDQQLPDTLPTFMQRFFKYEVAYELCNEYGIAWTAQKERQRQNLLTKVEENQDNYIGQRIKPCLKASRLPVPWLAYISGNFPTGL